MTWLQDVPRSDVEFLLGEGVAGRAKSNDVSTDCAHGSAWLVDTATLLTNTLAQDSMFGLFVSKTRTANASKIKRKRDIFPLPKVSFLRTAVSDEHTRVVEVHQ